MSFIVDPKINAFLKHRREDSLRERVVHISNESDFNLKILMDIENSPDGKYIRNLLETGIGLLPKKYRDAYYYFFKKDIDDIPESRRVCFEGSDKIYDITYLDTSLIEKIRDLLFEEDSELTSEDVTVYPCFSYIDDMDIATGFIAFFKGANPKTIEDIGLFSFDTENKDYGRQVWKDFDNCLEQFLDRGWEVNWGAYKENKACKHYDFLIEKFNGVKKSVGNTWRYSIKKEV